MKLCVLTFFTLLTIAEHAFAETVVRSADHSVAYALPDGYEENAVQLSSEVYPYREFVKLGGRQAFFDVFPSDSEPTVPWKEEVFDADVASYLRVTVVPLSDFLRNSMVPSVESQRQPQARTDAWNSRDVHQKICGVFSNIWGEDSFCFFNTDQDVGVSINLTGAFVAVFHKLVGDYVISIDTQDHIGFLDAYSHDSVLFGSTGRGNYVPKELPGELSQLTDSQKWRHFRQAANSQAVFELLGSARQLNDLEPEE